jgi:uncharacterized membrane protein
VTHWSFTVSGPILATALAAWLLSVGVSFLQWHRRGRRPGVLAMESLRLFIVALLAVALMKPELVQEIPHTQPPQVVILSDASGSMETRDVAGDGKNVVTRAEWLKASTAPERWKPLATKGRVGLENFPVPDASGDAGTDLNAALEKVLARTDNLKAVLLLTDGDWNAGQSPVVAATQCSARGIPIYAVGIGGETPLPDLVLQHTSTPAYGLLGDQITIPFKVQSHLPRPVQTTLTLADGKGIVASKAVTVPAFGQLADSLVWSPTEAGDYTMNLKLPIEPDEALTDNNERSFRIAARTETLNVLVIESTPRWEYRYLRNALSRDPGVHVETLLFHPGLPPGSGNDYLPAFPSGKEQLSKFDVVFLGDVGLGGNELAAAHLESLRALVEQQGSGLVFLPGMRGRQLTLAATPLGDLLPIEFDDSKAAGLATAGEAQILLTTEGQGHLLTMLAPDDATNAGIWRNLPGFYWSAAVRKSRPGAEVLAVHSTLRNESGRIPLLVTRPFGNGKVLFMGTDGAWRWRRGVEDKYHYRFWGQVVRWMAHQRHLAAGERIRLSFSPENPRSADTVNLLATVFDASGFPIEKGTVTAQIAAPNGSTERLELSAVPGGWGVFKGEFVARSGGKYQVTIANEAAAQRLTAPIFVEQPTREKIGQPANFAVLREMAEITRGAVGGVADLDAIVGRIALLPEPKPLERRLRLWSEWWSGAAIMALLAAYWTARKLSGMI